MIAEDLINTMIPPIKTTDKVEQVLDWMDKFRLREFAVVDDGRFLGIIREDEILNTAKKTDTVNKLKLSGKDISIRPFQHFYDIVKVAFKNDSDVVAVVDEGGLYLGVIDVKDVLSVFGEMSSMEGLGGIIILSMKEIDYSLSQISRLIEENDAKILSLQVSNDERDPTIVRVTLKLNTDDLTHINATLERFGYQLISTFQENEVVDDDKNRFDQFMKFLNI